MAIAHVQSKGAVGTNTVPTVVLTAAPTSGNLLVVVGISGTTTLLTMAAGWTPVDAGQTGGSGGTTRAIRAWYKIAAGESATIAAAANPGGTWGFVCAEYSGVDTTTPLIGGASQQNVSSTSQPTPSVTPTAGKSAVGIIVTHVKANSVAWSAETLGGTAMNERVDQPSTTTSTSHQLSDLLVASTSGAYAGASTSSVAATGQGYTMFFQEAIVAATSFPAVSRYRSNRHLIVR